MCGITGFNWDDKELVKRMCNSISHRGPDGEGFYNDERVSLGHRRLSIIDLSENGKQPMCNEDETVWIIFNGEIYNYSEIKSELEKKGHRFKSKTDTETIIHAYEEYGEECLHLFNGDFAFAIYDKNKKTIFLARDRLGIKPLYYFAEENKFIFASEIKAILQSPQVSKKVNLEALNKFVSYRYNFGEGTMLENIFKILPGTYLIYNLKDNFITKKVFWSSNFSDNGIINESEEYFAKKTRELFKDCVQKRLMSDVPLGVYLSGGIDSSSVVAMMSQIVKEPIKTFSVGFGFGEETDELNYAKKVSEKFGTEHKEFTVTSDLVNLLPKIIWHCDEPLADPALIPVYLLSEQAKKHVSVVLTGDGSDEIFAGYEQNKILTLARKTRFVPFRKQMASVFLKSIPTKFFDKFFKYSSALGEEGEKRALKLLQNISNPAKAYEEIVSIFDEDERKEVLLPDKQTCFSLSKYFTGKNNLVNEILQFELKNQLSDNMLLKADKMTMASGVESRVPFLDHRLVELSFRMPVKYKLKGLQDKYILKKAMNGTIPNEIINRKKQRFYVPIDLWMLKELKPMLDEELSQQNIERQGYFNYEYIAKVKEGFENSRLFYARQLWNILTFQLWHKKFIEDFDK